MNVQQAAQLLADYDGRATEDLIVRLRRIKYFQGAVDQLDRPELDLVPEILTDERADLELVLALRAAELSDSVALEVIQQGGVNLMPYVLVLFDAIQTAIDRIDAGNVNGALDMLTVALPGQ